ncbi:hypothetical protein PG993_013472 [Apiospora rasikravindrae]|uniref:F-box domain-containing protein n=1 Tax=Apiospora rasikravindrae TaxID=990691 RepID=A0ABR1RXR0_9PEZI
MEKVPAEVLSRILCYLDVPGRRNKSTPNPMWHKYATVCREWQHQVEWFNFQELLLTNDRMVDAQDVLTRQRLDYVRTIELRIRLPSYDEEARDRLENEEEKRRNNEVFTRTVGDFFSLLEPLSDCAPDNRGLKITAYSCSDIWHRRDGGRTRIMRKHYATKDICEARFQHSYLELLHVPNWPIGTLTSIDWCLSDREKRDLGLRACLRDSFARGLELLPDSLETVKLQYTYPPPNNHEFKPASVSAGTDKLSVALHALCQRVKFADVEASVTSDFFWPSTASMTPCAIEPCQEWPHLRSISLTAAEADPNGNWLFDRHCKFGPGDAAGVEEEAEDFLKDDEPDTPANEDRREKDFRGSPNERLISAWNIAIARAAGRMPLLKDLHVTIAGRGGPRPYQGDYRVTYLVADRRLTIESTPVLAMDDALRDVWKEVVMTHGMPDGAVEMELIDSIHPSLIWMLHSPTV